MKHKRDYTADNRLLYLSAIALGIGALSTCAAWLLLKLIALFTNLFYFQRFSFSGASPAAHALGWIAIFLPIAGGLVVGLMARYGSEKIRGHGIPEAIEAILFGKSLMSPKVAVLKPLSSGIVIGSGGPFGAEGPIIMTGGSIGSLLAQFLHLTAAERKTLLVAGACAGMTAIFGTPVAALLLAVELLLFELKPRSLLPVALACALAGFLRPLLVDAGPLFAMQVAAPDTLAFASCIAAGLASGVLAAVLTLALYRVEDWFHHLKLHWMWWPAIGGVAVGIGGWLEPRALGGGYDV
ncbi:chloride channel protein, partial [Herbaspirillum sp.]|uniref:chloride channel protein n=1 Tax=Herbaspirillum sp. TaxID=1890675 RepID=UPI0031D608F1